MPSDPAIVDDILDATGAPRDLIEAIAAHIESAPEESSPEFNALWSHWEPGRDASVTSIKPRNLVLNWKKLMFAAVGVGGAVLGVVAAPFTVLAAVGLAMASIPALAIVAAIDLGDDHSHVVTTLWKSFPDQEVVTVDDLAQALETPLTPQRLEVILAELSRLAVIQREGKNIRKRDRIFIGRQ